MKLASSPTKLIRTHITIPGKLVSAVDRIVGERRRSQYVAQALEEKLARDRLGAALAAAAGTVNRADHPAWATPEQTSAWVRALRRENEERVSRAWSKR